MELRHLSWSAIRFFHRIHHLIFIRCHNNWLMFLTWVSSICCNWLLVDHWWNIWYMFLFDHFHWSLQLNRLCGLLLFWYVFHLVLIFVSLLLLLTLLSTFLITFIQSFVWNHYSFCLSTFTRLHLILCQLGHIDCLCLIFAGHTFSFLLACW